MNQSALHFTLVNYIADLMVMAKLNEIEPYHLCCHQGSLRVLNARHTLIQHPIFHNFTGEQTHRGCSQVELCKITSKIINFLQENSECLKQFKL